MGLAKYRQKRSFKETPEPKGAKSKRTKSLRFVVQKHAATRLHYDFRLELDGVLKSWAVPKGPSLDPADKRLAMMVEDHPYDYRSFEGTIPEGNYGAGSVIVWDQGTYRSLEEKPGKRFVPAKTVDQVRLLRAGIKAGDLKFTLSGKKLRGGYALVKMKGRGENNWLLIKKQDEHATTKDVTKDERSVKTGLTLDQVSERAKPQETPEPKEPKVTSAARTAFPTGTKPMLAASAPEAFDRDSWLFEIKWDGYRIVAEVRGGTANLRSRNDQDYSERYAPITAALAGLGHEAVIDGEMVCVDGKGRSRFQLLQQYHETGKGKLLYYAFDLLHLDGHDLTKMPLRDRKELLSELLPANGPVRLSDHVETKGEAFFKAAAAQGLEGIMAKDSASPYLSGRRSDSWLKVKAVERQEAVIAGYTAPGGSRKGFGALILAVPKGKGFRYIGHAGTGFDQRTISSLLRKLKPLVRKTSVFAATPKTNARPTWVKPELVCEVSYTEWTGEGHLRHPVFVGLREDKPSAAVRKEPVPVASPPAGADERVEKISGHEVKLTHLSKTFFPKDKLTKGDVIAYYRDVSRYILSYLKDRPESLNRHPNGIDGKSFYQKDVRDQPPSWVRTKKIYSESNDKHLNWLLCQDEATLVYLANLACIELHPWHSRANSLTKPDYLLVDLDAKTSGFDTVVDVAKEVRKVLEKINALSVPKTSGKSGLHICIPLGAKYTYEQSKQFAEILMHLVHDRLPEVTSLERNPDKRQKKVYLDFLQNRRGQTMAAPYCLRPVPGATVSTPLEWTEVRKGLDPQQFTIRTIGKRLERKGDLWKPVLGKGIDLPKALEKLG